MIECRGNLAGRQHSSRRQQAALWHGSVRIVSLTLDCRLYTNRTDHYAGPGRQSPQKGDGDRVSTAVQGRG